MQHSIDQHSVVLSNLADVKGQLLELQNTSAAKEAVQLAFEKVGLHSSEGAAPFSKVGHPIGAVVDQKVFEVLLLLWREHRLPRALVVQ